MANPPYGKCYPYEAPAAGEDDQRAKATEWRHIGGAWGDGIVNATNPGGSSDFSLTPSTSDRTVVLNLGEFRMRGIQFEPTQSTLTLTIPPVTAGATRADRLLARLDPAAKQITFYIKAGTEVTTGSPVAPAVTRVTGGVWEFVLWRIEGGNTQASGLTYTDNRLWIAQTVHANTPPGTNPNLNLGLTDGSRAFHLPRMEEWVQTYPGGVATWTNVDAPVWSDLTLSGGGVLATQGSVAPAYSRVRGWVRLRGAVRRTNANPLAGAGQDTTLGTLPAGFRPGGSVQFPAATSVDGGGGRVGIGTDGVVHFIAYGAATWASLDGVTFYAEN